MSVAETAIAARMAAIRRASIDRQHAATLAAAGALDRRNVWPACAFPKERTALPGSLRRRRPRTMTLHDSALSILDRYRFDLLRAFALLVATLIGLGVCYLVALPFLPALVWALTAAVLALPLHRRLERRLKHPNAAAAVSLSLLALLVFIPLIFVGHQLFGVLSTGVASLQDQLASGELQRFVESQPLLARLINLVAGQMDAASIFGNVAAWLTNLGASILRSSLANVVTVLLTFYLLFYFLRDHREALLQSKMLSPFTESETDYLFGRVSDTIHAIIFGTVIAAAVQGALGGAMFWLLGLPDPLFWGLVMALLAIIPVLGAFVVWIPAALYLAVTGEWGKAAILAAWGSLAIGGIDNILHPVLAGGRLRLHTVPTFISIVGGLMLFGASGLILGPLAVTITIAILEVWRARADAAETRTGAAQGRMLQPDA
jgi:predicted PurR-regulated permease PerM